MADVGTAESVPDVHGVVDVHVHFGPDQVPRSQTAVSIARRAEAAGMAGVCLKSHTLPTVQVANAAREFTSACEIFGGVTLNHAVGGINPGAVEATLDLGGRMVWMPTKDAANHRVHFGQDSANAVRPVDADGKPTAALQAVLRLVAEAGACLSTGHLGASEATTVLRCALDAGVEHVIVAHPLFETQRLSIETQQRLAAAGAYLEHCWLQVAPGYPRGAAIQDLVAAIHAVGAERVVLSSDSGRAGFPDTVTAMSTFRRELAQHFTFADLDRMFMDNPARCMGTA